jgi:hypothetical protein
MKKGINRAVYFLTVMFCMPAVAWTLDQEDGAMTHKSFALFAGTGGKPFTLFNPIEPAGPGEISDYSRTAQGV